MNTISRPISGIQAHLFLQAVKDTGPPSNSTLAESGVHHRHNVRARNLSPVFFHKVPDLGFQNG